MAIRAGVDRTSRRWTEQGPDDDRGRLELQRLIALGATAPQCRKRPRDADYVILADPEGNRFCVVDTTC